MQVIGIMNIVLMTVLIVVIVAYLVKGKGERMSRRVDENGYVAITTEAQAATDAARHLEHGRWLDRFVIPITCASDIEFVQEAKCSNCRRWHERPYWYGGFTDYTYCPWCCAKMDEVSE